MEDHYHELIEQGKSEHEAIRAVISEFGSIDELLQELQVAQSEDTAEEAWLDAITIDEAFDFGEDSPFCLLTFFRYCVNVSLLLEYFSFCQ